VLAQQPARRASGVALGHQLAAPGELAGHRAAPGHEIASNARVKSDFGQSVQAADRLCTSRFFQASPGWCESRGFTDQVIRQVCR
jgi:hypothetical protein